MRVHMGEFVGAAFTLPQNPIVGAGLAAFVPAHFTLPQSVIGGGMAGYPTTYLPSHPAVGVGSLPYMDPREAWAHRRGGIGEMVKARWTIPQNPFLITHRDLATQGALAGLDGCSCGGSCSNCSSGMGDLNSIGDTIGGMWTSLNSHEVGGIPMGYLVIGGVALFIFMTGRGKEYRAAKSDLKRKYSTRGRRVAAAVA